MNPLPLLLLLLLSCVLSDAKKPSSHPHSGLLTPYKTSSFDDVKLDKSDEKKLASGTNVMKQIPAADGGAGGRALCIQDITAPTQHIWNQILDFNSYVGKVPKLKECKNYFVGDDNEGAKRIKTKMVVGVLPGYKYTYYVDHKYHKGESSLMWSLDYQKYSDFDDVQGHWKVRPHPLIRTLPESITPLI